MKRAIALAALLVASCAPEPGPQDMAAVTSLPACNEGGLNGELVASECQLQAAGQTLYVQYAALAAGASGGNVTVNVLGDDGAPVQALLETDVSGYLPPNVQDIDGDGRADILIRRATGNVNSEMALWVFNGERGRYERVGMVSGVEIERTEEGYIAVPARSSAAEWNVAFYRLDESGLAPLVTVTVMAEDIGADGGAARSACRIADAPGLPDLNLSEQQAEAKFCAEPSAGVFAP